MKKRIALMLAGLLLCSAFAGCGQTDANSSGAVPAGEMQLAPMQLSDEQYSVLSLADIGVQEFIAYEYQADENLRCITITRYILNDALEWEPADSGSGRTYGDAPPLSPIGAISQLDIIREENGRCHAQLTGQPEDGEDICRRVFFAFCREKLPLLQLNMVKASLEDIFLELTGKAASL